MENTPSGFTVSANDNLIVGFSTSEVIISPTAPEITPLMTVLLSEDNIAVEVCVGSAEFDSPDGEAAEVEVSIGNSLFFKQGWLNRPILWLFIF